MAFFIYNYIEFKDITSGATVPDDPRAQLMYYLRCMCFIVDLTDTSPNLQRLRNYSNYSITSDEKEIHNCVLNNHLLIAGNVIIGERNVRMNKIRTFKRNWLEDNYYTTLNILLLQLHMRRQNNAMACAIS
ncbi:hypothetical protein ACJMK2_018749 [Sinanodonta woodiana]|uniref:Uncharacterized protein n=1 Tax=Sinanodonta woodiana TaxID=1069815 RepID=A0ABD3UHE7_SINWO